MSRQRYLWRRYLRKNALAMRSKTIPLRLIAEENRRLRLENAYLRSARRGRLQHIFTRCDGCGRRTDLLLLRRGSCAECRSTE